MADIAQFRYRAIDPAGRRTRAPTSAADEASAFDVLRGRGLTPLDLRRGAAVAAPDAPVKPAQDREAADFLSSLAYLLAAGADIRTALGILGGGPSRPAVRQIVEALNADISGGE